MADRQSHHDIFVHLSVLTDNKPIVPSDMKVLCGDLSLKRVDSGAKVHKRTHK